jgi:type IV pilus assembly protein PilM
VIGLDIGTSHVRAAEVSFPGGRASGKGIPEVVRYGEVPLPSGAVRDGEVAERETVASALRQLWIETKFSSRDVVLGVGNQRVLVRDLDLPAMPLAQLRTSLPFQVHDMLPVAVEDVLLDYYPTSTVDGPHGPLVRGLLVAATKDTIKASTAAVELAKLRPVMVDLEAFALARVQARGDLATRTIAFVDVGARVTNVVIVSSGQPRFVRILANGGQDATDAVTHAMSVSPEIAEAMKRDVGIGYAVPPELEPARQAVYDVTTALIEAVRNTMVYYAGSNPGAAAEQIVLSGGGSLLGGLGQYMSSASRLPVSMGEPLSTLRVDRSIAGRRDFAAVQSTMTIALGLAFGVAA